MNMRELNLQIYCLHLNNCMDLNSASNNFYDYLDRIF